MYATRSVLWDWCLSDLLDNWGLQSLLTKQHMFSSSFLSIQVLCFASIRLPGRSRIGLLVSLPCPTRRATVWSTQTHRRCPRAAQVRIRPPVPRPPGCAMAAQAVGLRQGCI